MANTVSYKVIERIEVNIDYSIFDAGLKVSQKNTNKKLGQYNLKLIQTVMAEEEGCLCQ